MSHDRPSSAARSKPRAATFLRHPRAASAAVAALLVTMALVQLRGGPDSTPDPVREILIATTGHEPAVAARVLIALEFGLAAAVLAAGARVLAVGSAVIVAFVALSCASRGLRTGGLATPLVALVAAGAVAWWAARTTRAPRALSRRGLSYAWTALAGIAAGTLASASTAALDFTKPAAKPGPAVRSIDLDLKPYVDRLFDDTPLLAYMPALRDFVSEGTAFVVFYNPSCETCHTLFEDHFMVPRPEKVVAVEIPLGVDAVSAAREAPRPLECFDCVKLSLEPGPNWIIAAPMTAKFVDGKLVCVADRFGGDCLTVEENN